MFKNKHNGMTTLKGYISISVLFAPNPSVQDSDRTINYDLVCDNNGKS
jgi:hypothetical protein